MRLPASSARPSGLPRWPRGISASREAIPRMSPIVRRATDIPVGLPLTEAIALFSLRPSAVGPEGGIPNIPSAPAGGRWRAIPDGYGRHQPHGSRSTTDQRAGYDAVEMV